MPGSGAGVAAILFDIDGTLISTGGACDRAWHRAFLELYGVEVDVPDYTGKGVPDPGRPASASAARSAASPRAVRWRG